MVQQQYIPRTDANGEPRGIPGVTCCSRCSSFDLVVNEEHRLVCRGCAFVNPYFFEGTPAKKSTYKRISHLNERFAQWTLNDPPIPEDLYELIENEAYGPQYPNFDDLTKQDIRKICQSVKVPPDVAKKYANKKGVPLRNLTRYVERWLTIKFKLSGVRPTIATQWVIEEVKTRFTQLQVPFEYIRHTDKCDRSTHKCHKTHKCRYNFPNYNFLIIEVLKLVVKDDKVVEQQFLPVFPQLKTKPKLRKLQAMWTAMVDWIGWGKVYPIQGRKQKLLDRLSQNYHNRLPKRMLGPLPQAPVLVSV